MYYCSLSYDTDEFFVKNRLVVNENGYIMVLDKNDPTPENFYFGKDIDNLVSVDCPMYLQETDDFMLDFSISPSGDLYATLKDSLYRFDDNSWVSYPFRFDLPAPSIDVLGFDDDNDPILELSEAYFINSQGTNIPIIVSMEIARFKNEELLYYPDSHLGVDINDENIIRFPRFIEGTRIYYEAVSPVMDSMALGTVENLFEDNLFILDRDGIKESFRTLNFPDSVPVTASSITNVKKANNTLYFNHRKPVVQIPSDDNASLTNIFLDKMITTFDLDTYEQDIINDWSALPSIYLEPGFSNMYSVDDKIYGINYNTLYTIVGRSVKNIQIDIDKLITVYPFRNESEYTEIDISGDIADISVGKMKGLFQMGGMVYFIGDYAFYEFETSAIKPLTSVVSENSQNRLEAYYSKGVLHFKKMIETEAYLFDINGKLLMEIQANTESIDMSPYPVGTYIVMKSFNTPQFQSFKFSKKD
jgi:hypothetical protein